MEERTNEISERQVRQRPDGFGQRVMVGKMAPGGVAMVSRCWRQREWVVFVWCDVAVRAGRDGGYICVSGSWVSLLLFRVVWVKKDFLRFLSAWSVIFALRARRSGM